MATAGRKGLAALLSALLPGLGQFYNRQWAKGAGFLLGTLVLDAVFGVSSDTLKLLQAVGSGASIGTRLRRPFECVIAPWLDANKMRAAMQGYGLRGISFPTFSVTHEGQRLHGVLLKINEPARAPLVAINFYLLDAIEKASGRDLFTEAVRRKRDFQMFDKVCGTDELRRQLKAGKSAMEIVESWKAGEEAFRQQRRKYLIYMEAASTQSAPANESSPARVAESKPARAVEDRTDRLLVALLAQVAHVEKRQIGMRARRCFAHRRPGARTR